MSVSKTVAALSLPFALYPAWTEPGGEVEAIIERSPIVEMIIRCNSGPTAIMYFSPIEDLFCTSRHQCSADFDLTITRQCE